jgi:phage gpG-like protein
VPPIRVLRGEKQLGTFGSLGGMMRLDAEPDPERVSFGLMKLAGYVETTQVPMQAAKRIAQEDMQQHFDTDTDPEGNPWTPLDPDYQRKKIQMGGDPNNILTLSSRLERGATSSAAWIATEEALFFNTASLPDYWDVHQSGSDEAGLAGYAGSVRERIRGGNRLEDDPTGSHDSLGLGRGKSTPARPFIGLSIEAQAQIVELFDLWFDEGVDLYVRSSGIVQQRVGGRFGPKIFPNF